MVTWRTVKVLFFSNQTISLDNKQLRPRPDPSVTFRRVEPRETCNEYHANHFDGFRVLADMRSVVQEKRMTPAGAGGRICFMDHELRSACRTPEHLLLGVEAS
jgi:hypothetical protein